MSRPSFILVLHPMPGHGMVSESWDWPGEIISRFGKYKKSSGQIWLDAESGLPEDLFSIMRSLHMPRPCTSLLGYASKGVTGPHNWFQLRLRDEVELLQEGDNYSDQYTCGWGFPLQRTGISGCVRGGKVRNKPYRFPKRFKVPRYDLFWIAPGPRISSGFFGASDKALSAMLSVGLTGFNHLPILDFFGNPSGFNEIEVVGTAGAIRQNSFQVVKVCGICELNIVHPPKGSVFTSIPPPDVSLGGCDVQVIKMVDNGEAEVYSDFWPPIVSLKFVSMIDQFSLTGLDKGAAGGSYEPFVTRAFSEQLGAWRPSFV